MEKDDQGNDIEPEPLSIKEMLEEFKAIHKASLHKEGLKIEQL